MLPPFPAGDPSIASTTWLSWFAKLRFWINTRPFVEAVNNGSSTITSPGSTYAPLDLITLNVGVPLSAGSFTAPWTGIYLLGIFVDFGADDAAGVAAGVGINVETIKNGTPIGIQFTRNGDIGPAESTSATATVVIYGGISLVKGDIIQVRYSCVTANSVRIQTASLSMRFIQ